MRIATLASLAVLGMSTVALAQTSPAPGNPQTQPSTTTSPGTMTPGTPQSPTTTPLPPSNADPMAAPMNSTDTMANNSASIDPTMTDNSTTPTKPMKKKRPR